MSTAVPQLSIQGIWAGLKALAFRLIADPKLVDKVQALWNAITAFWPAPAPQAAAAETAESWFADVPPEKLFDGRIISLISNISQWIDAHPKLVSFLLTLLTLIPKEQQPETV